jgi:GNAT superfamily N-acetyltransferase
VQYPVLVRGGGEIAAVQPPALTARPMSADEARRLLSSPGPWYLPSGAAAALALVEAGIAEFHAAFDGDKPVTLGVLVIEGECGYLGFATTDPAQRRRGGQTALIRSRVRRALERGARWCVSETNTAVASSQGNLERSGFRSVFCYRVYQWDAAARDGPAGSG